MSAAALLALALAVLFLELNGYRFDAAPADTTVRTFALAAGALTEHGFANWLKTNARLGAALASRV